VEVNGKGLLNEGDLSTLSFHATKVFNTIEGGAMIMHDEKMKRRIDDLKNFGIHDEVTVVGPGINSKMDELRSAYGLLNLKQVDKAIEARHKVAIKYRQELKNIEGITFFEDMPGVKHNYSYFPIFVDKAKFGMSRDDLYFKMRENNILGRRYFYPLISEFSTYKGLESAKPENLPNAHRMADTVLCLPMYHTLSEEDIARVINIIKK
jgi:dTDP-4-amino-4,6-dideoxygalactose transaminase